jgi:hypothetical protein
MDQAAKKIEGHSGAVSIVAAALIAVIHVYQRTLSPLLGVHCRFEPTCSRYAEEALRTHGAVRGSGLAVRRLLRCHPFGGRGYDPVPRFGGERAANEAGEHEQGSR